MEEIQRLVTYWFPVLVVELAVTKGLGEDDTFPGEVQVDGTVQTLDAILDEQGDFDVLVLEELAQLLAHHHHVPG